MVTTTRIKLSTWAAQQGVHQKTALRWCNQGKLSGAVQTASGRWVIEEQLNGVRTVVLYGRVSSGDQRDDLERQMGRLRDFAAARGLVIAKEVTEIGSGLNGHRRMLRRLLADAGVAAIVVEHRDRLARFGVEYIEAALEAHGRTVIVVNDGEQKLDIVQDFIDVVTSMCTRIYGRRAAKNRAKRALAAASEEVL